jgi:broad specificity phosphatase PhoE
MATGWDAVRTSIPPWEQIERRLEELVDPPGLKMCLVRHGESTTNRQGLVTGRHDASLTERGRHQARVLGRALRGERFDVAFSSHLKRSVQTFEHMREASHLAVEMYSADARLAERDYGCYELTPAESLPDFARRDLRYVPPGGGESYLAVAHRCLAFLTDLVDLAVWRGSPLNVLICTHAGPMRILTGLLDQCADPASVLARQFDNAVLARRELHEIWPAPFLGLVTVGDT